MLIVPLLICGLAVQEVAAQSSPLRAGPAQPAPTVGQAAPSAQVAANTEQNAPSTPSPAHQAVDAFEREDYPAAIALFRSALKANPPLQERSVLLFNTAVCLFELRRFPEAEETFQQTAALNAANAKEATLNAGLAAAAAGNGKRATGYLAAAKPVPEALGDTAQALAQAIHQRAEERRMQELEKAESAATAALARKNSPEARRLFLQALALNDEAETQRKADILHGLALTELEDGKLAPAARYVREALALSPGSGEPLITKALVHIERGELDAARGALKAALHSELKPKRKALVQQRLYELLPIRAPGWFWGAALGGGRESNADQSGTAQALGVSGEQSGTPSGTLRLGLDLGYAFELGEHWRLLPSYSGVKLALTNPAVSDLGLTVHELNLELQHALDAGTAINLSVGTTHLRTGFPATDPFSIEAVTNAGARVSHGRHWLTAVQAWGRRSWGLGGREELNGLRLDLVVSESWRKGIWSASLDLSYAYNRMGVQEVPVSQGLYDRCTRLPPRVVCDSLFHRVPLSYSAPQLRLGGGLQLLPRFGVQLSGAAQRRTYLEASELRAGRREQALEEGTRRQEDLQLRWSAQAVWMPVWFVDGQLTLTYTRTRNTSTIAQDPMDPQHALDYANRNFTQDTIEAGLRWLF